MNGVLTAWIKGWGRVRKTIIQVMKEIYYVVDGFLKERLQSGRGNGGKLTVEQQQEILVYSIIDKFLHSYELFLDWRDTIFPAAKESIVRDNFDFSLEKQNSAVQISMMLKAILSVRWFARSNKKISAYTVQAQDIVSIWMCLTSLIRCWRVLFVILFTYIRKQCLLFRKAEYK